jgi:hypothetical protein
MVTAVALRTDVALVMDRILFPIIQPDAMIQVFLMPVMHTIVVTGIAATIRVTAIILFIIT